MTKSYCSLKSTHNYFWRPHNLKPITMKKLTAIAMTCAALLFAGAPAQAATYTFANGNITATPTATLYWGTGSTPVATWDVTPVSGNGNTIQFFQDTTTALVNTGTANTQSANQNIANPLALGTLSLEGLGSATASAKLTETISGSSLNFSAATGTVNLDSLNNGSNGKIAWVLNGNIQLGTASSACALTFQGNGTAAFQVNGAISELQTGGGSLIKSGSSTLVLTATGTYTGGTTLSGGTLQANGSSVFGSGPITINSSAVSLSFISGLTIANNITISGGTGSTGNGLVRSTSTTAATTLSGGTINITASPANGGHFSGNSATVPFNINDSISSTVPVTWRANYGVFGGGGSYNNFSIGSGTVGLGAANGLSTSATVDFGASGAAILDLAGYNQTLAGMTKNASATGATIANSSTGSGSKLTTTGTSSFGGIIQDTTGSGTKTVALTVNGGALTLSGANTYSGGTTVSAGTLTLSGSGTPGSTSGALTMDGGTFDLGALTTPTVGAVTISGAPASGNTIQNGTLTASSYSDTHTANTATITAILAGPSALSKSGSAPLLLSGANKYSGGTTLSGGNLMVGVGNVGSVGSITSSAIGTGGLTFNVGGISSDSTTTRTVLNGLTFTGNANLGDATQTGKLTFSANGDLGSSVRALTLNSDAEFDGVLSGSGGGINKSGSGILTLTNANTYTGGTAVSAGTLVANYTNAIGTGLLTLAGGTLSNSLSYTLTNAVNLSSASSVGIASGITLTVGGPITNAGALTLAGPGTLTLGGGAGNTFSGPINVNAGTLKTVNGASLKFVTNTITVASGAVFNLVGNFDGAVCTNQIVLSGTGSGSMGAFNIGANATEYGTITLLTNSKITHDYNNGPIYGPINGSGYNLEIDNTVSGQNGISIPGSINLGAGGLTVASVSGSSSVSLSGNNTYSGPTTISSGTLALSGGGLITNSATIVVASNAVFDVSGLASPFTLAQSLSSQTLSNSAPGAIISGTNNCSAGILSLVYDGVNPAFTITNGGMTLSAGTTFKVNKSGVPLPLGVYKIVAKASSGTPGMVAGAVPAVTVANGTSGASLGIVGGEIYLTNGQPSTWSYSATGPFTYNGAAQSPVVNFSGSTGFKTTNFVGIGTTTYSSVNSPTSAGTYYVSNTAASDANYFGTANSQSFTINQATSTISYGGTTTFIYNGTAQTPGITGISGSTGGRTTNYVGTGSTSYSSSTAPVNAGSYALTNTVLSDANYIGATNGVTFTVGQTNLTITARTNTKIFDGSTSATNTPIITAGSLQGSDAAILTEAYADASVGTGKTLIPSIAITNTGVNVVANYNVSTVNDTTGVINPDQSTTTLLLTNTIGVTNYYGQTLIFTAVVQTNNMTAANASSNVVFSLGSNPVWTNAVVSGVAYYTNDDLTVGTTNFTAQYLGDNNYLGSTVTVTQTVLQATPTLTLTASSITYGQTLGSSSLSGSVATNDYDVDADADAAVGGTFAFASTGIAPNAGATNVWVIFTPTDTTNYTTASNTVSVTVNKANSSVTVTGTTTFTYDGAGQGPTGAGVAGSSGAVSFSYSGTGYGPSSNTPTNVGSYTVTATVAADQNYNSATSSPTAFNISPAPASVTADAKTKTYGTVNPTLTATVVGQVVGGDTVSYSLITDAGQYSHVGVSNITVTLGSNPNYSVSATNGTLTIYQANTFVGASSTENPSGYKDAISFTATLPADVTGSVVFSSTNGPISTNTISSGIATSLSITNLPRGTNVITVAYLGDGNYLGSTTNLDQIVTNHPPVAAVMTVTRTAGLALIIKLSDIATNWNDVDGDTVELTSVTTQSTNGVNLFPLNWSTNLDGSIVTTNGYAYIGYTNSPNVNDQISYGISDGQGGTNIGYVNIVIQGSVTGTNSITAYNFTSPASNTVTAYGIPYFSYILERSTNLSSPAWVEVQTNQAAPNGVINMVDLFLDLGGIKPSPAFYQLKWQP